MASKTGFLAKELKGLEQFGYISTNKEKAKKAANAKLKPKKALHEGKSASSFEHDESSHVAPLPGPTLSDLQAKFFQAREDLETLQETLKGKTILTEEEQTAADAVELKVFRCEKVFKEAKAAMEAAEALDGDAGSTDEEPDDSSDEDEWPEDKVTPAEPLTPVPRDGRKKKAKPWFGLRLSTDKEASKRWRLIGKVAEFSGKSGEEIDVWLRAFTLLVNCNRWGEDIACSYFATALSGAAAQWYQTSQMSSGSGLKMMMRAIRKQFGEPEELQEARYERAARDRRQSKEETVAAYAVALEHVCERALIDEGEMTRLFIRGLHPYLQEALLLKGRKVSASFALAVAAAKKHECARVVANKEQPVAQAGGSRPRGPIGAVAPRQGGFTRGAFPPSYSASPSSLPVPSGIPVPPGVKKDGNTGQGAPARPPVRPWNPTCYYCGGTGHIKPGCPKLRADQMARTTPSAPRIPTAAVGTQGATQPPSSSTEGPASGQPQSNGAARL